MKGHDNDVGKEGVRVEPKDVAKFVVEPFLPCTQFRCTIPLSFQSIKLFTLKVFMW